MSFGAHCPNPQGFFPFSANNAKKGRKLSRHQVDWSRLEPPSQHYNKLEVKKEEENQPTKELEKGEKEMVIAK